MFGLWHTGSAFFRCWQLEFTLEKRKKERNMCFCLSFSTNRRQRNTTHEKIMSYQIQNVVSRHLLVTLVTYTDRRAHTRGIFIVTGTVWKKNNKNNTQHTNRFVRMLRMSLRKSLVSNCLSNNNNQFLRMNVNSVEFGVSVTEIIRSYRGLS